MMLPSALHSAEYKTWRTASLAASLVISLCTSGRGATPLRLITADASRIWRSYKGVCFMPCGPWRLDLDSPLCRAALGRLDGVAQKHGDGHRAHAAGNRRDVRSLLLHRVEIDVAHQRAVGQPVDADVDDYRTGLDHGRGDQPGFARRHHQDVGEDGE